MGQYRIILDNVTVSFAKTLQPFSRFFAIGNISLGFSHHVKALVKLADFSEK
jgi:hypothetical protein